MNEYFAEVTTPKTKLSDLVLEDLTRETLEECLWEHRNKERLVKKSILPISRIFIYSYYDFWIQGIPEAFAGELGLGLVTIPGSLLATANRDVLEFMIRQSDPVVIHFDQTLAIDVSYILAMNRTPSAVYFGSLRYFPGGPCHSDQWLRDNGFQTVMNPTGYSTEKKMEFITRTCERYGLSDGQRDEIVASFAGWSASNTVVEARVRREAVRWMRQI